MKKWTEILVVLVGVFLLTACNQKSDVSENKKLIESTAEVKGNKSSELSEEEKISIAKKQYAAVFEDYEAIINFANSHNEKYVGLVNDFSHQLKTSITRASVESSIATPENLVYTIYDLNKDRQMEMLVANIQQDGTIVPIGTYYLKAGQPSLLSQGYVASAGGGREITQIYSDGTALSYNWYSGTGEGIATLYQIQKNNQEAIILKEQEFRIGDGELDTIFGKSKNEHLNLKELNWQKFEVETNSYQSNTSQIFPQKLIGSWRVDTSDFGEVTMIFSDDGQVAMQIKKLQSVSVTKVISIEEVGYNTYRYNVSEGESTSALFPAHQLGGAGVKYEAGFRLEGDILTTLVWEARMNEEFDYSNPTQFQRVFQKY